MKNSLIAQVLGPAALGSVTALVLAAPALAQQSGSVSDFQLPSDDATPQARPQGPVADGIAPPRVARPTPTPAPAPAPTVDAAPVPAVTATPAPAASGPPSPAATRPSATPTAAADSPVVADETGGATAATTPLPSASTGATRDLPAAAAPPAAAPVPASAPVDGGIAWWVWALALLAVGALGALAGWVWRGRRSEAPLLVDMVERPRLPERAPDPVSPPAELPKVALTRKPADPAPLPVADDADDDAPEAPLRIALEPARLSVSLLNATLAYRILLTNQGEAMLRDISIDGDMISAHASLAPEEQLAAINSQLANRHLVRRLAPGETKVVNGEFALPLPLIRPIRKGDAALFVPLARLRVVASRDGGDVGESLVQTSVVGQRSLRPGGGLRPFRLDLGPRIYSELGQRAFA